jgi:hypothetical protein
LIAGSDAGPLQHPGATGELTLVDDSSRAFELVSDAHAMSAEAATMQLSSRTIAT